jgi:hypothetical protein
VDCPINRKVFQFLDPDFVKRVKWFIRDNVFHIEGNLTVAIPLSVPIVFGCCGAFDPMRQWVAEMHPDRPAKKLVIYYSRGGSTDTSHGRIIDISLEKEIIEYIRAAMQRHGKKEDLVVFNGQFEGRTMPIERQFALFRSASTIIGPHGTGIGGNFVWTNPFSRTCEERTQLLEFITGQESAQVQNLYATYVSGDSFLFLLFRTIVASYRMWSDTQSLPTLESGHWITTQFCTPKSRTAKRHLSIFKTWMMHLTSCGEKAQLQLHNDLKSLQDIN